MLYASVSTLTWFPMFLLKLFLFSCVLAVSSQTASQSVIQIVLRTYSSSNNICTYMYVAEVVFTISVPAFMIIATVCVVRMRITSARSKCVADLQFLLRCVEAAHFGYCAGNCGTRKVINRLIRKKMRWKLLNATCDFCKR